MAIDHVMRRVTDAQRAVLCYQRMLEGARRRASIYERRGYLDMLDEIAGHISWLEREVRYYESELELAEANYQTALQKSEIGGAIDEPTTELQ